MEHDNVDDVPEHTQLDEGARCEKIVGMIESLFQYSRYCPTKTGNIVELVLQPVCVILHVGMSIHISRKQARERAAPFNCMERIHLCPI